MNKKYDYFEIISSLKKNENKFYISLSSDNESTAVAIYNAICELNTEKRNTFSLQKSLFTSWLLDSAKDNDFSRLDCYVLNTINASNGFFNSITGSLSNQQANNILIKVWSNKAKTLKCSQLKGIYANFLRYLNSKAGQSFLFSKSIYDNDINIKYSDVPFYETAEYKSNIMNRLKKNIIIDCSDNLFENKVLQILWNETFSSDKFKYNNCAKKIRIAVPENKISDSTLYRTMHKLHKRMLESMLSSKDFEDAFEIDHIFDINGKLITLRNVIIKYLEDVNIEIKNDNNITYDMLENGIRKYAYSVGAKIKTHTFCGNCFMSLNIDCNKKLHKRSKIYLYKNGGFQDFVTGRTGKIVGGLIPKVYFK